MLKRAYDHLERYEEGQLGPAALLSLAIIFLLAWMTYAATWGLIAWAVISIGQAIVG